MGPEAVAPRKAAAGDSETAPASLRRSDVLRAAAQVFMDKGYGSASINDIARHMGSTKGKIYYHYSSKYELYLDIHLTALRLAAERCLAARDRESAPDRQLYALVFEQALINLEDSPMNRVAIQGLERNMLRPGGGSLDAGTRRLLELRSEFEQIYVDVIGRGAEQGLFPAGTDARLCARWVLGLVNWIVIWTSPRNSPPSAREHMASSAASFALAGVTGWNAAGQAYPPIPGTSSIRTPA